MSTLHLTPSGDPQLPIVLCNERGGEGERREGEGREGGSEPGKDRGRGKGGKEGGREGGREGGEERKGGE